MLNRLDPVADMQHRDVPIAPLGGSLALTPVGSSKSKSSVALVHFWVACTQARAIHHYYSPYYHGREYSPGHPSPPRFLRHTFSRTMWPIATSVINGLPFDIRRFYSIWRYFPQKRPLAIDTPPIIRRRQFFASGRQWPASTSLLGSEHFVPPLLRRAMRNAARITDQLRAP